MPRGILSEAIEQCVMLPAYANFIVYGTTHSARHTSEFEDGNEYYYLNIDFKRYSLSGAQGYATLKLLINSSVTAEVFESYEYKIR